MTRKINTAWFKNKIKDRDGTQRKLAQFTRLDPSAISLMLSGARDMTLDEAALIAEFLGEPIVEVLRNAGIPERALMQKNKIPVVGYVDDTDTVSLAEKPDFVLRPKAVPDHCEALRYTTAMTTKDVYDGWVFFYTPSTDVKIDAVGRLCVVLVAGDSSPKIRFVRRRYVSGCYALASLCGGGHDEAELVYASPIDLIQT